MAVEMTVNELIEWTLCLGRPFSEQVKIHKALEKV